ncbi:hypothetical protein N0V93_003675 [Gnomoniopsis smithogilvyi]|uniref:Uncharacterized protein n=1 Tax=Gnomoniopsis smithogilvyi TaxID=1191159 RepID=A0A9W8YXJ8_9PEZI|nr:hypothetical protein N0V93_003675 [Gnomoniopsis smithogilvyi]
MFAIGRNFDPTSYATLLRSRRERKDATVSSLAESPASVSASTQSTSRQDPLRPVTYLANDLQASYASTRTTAPLSPRNTQHPDAPVHAIPNEPGNKANTKEVRQKRALPYPAASGMPQRARPSGNTGGQLTRYSRRESARSLRSASLKQRSLPNAFDSPIEIDHASSSAQGSLYGSQQLEDTNRRQPHSPLRARSEGRPMAPVQMWPLDEQSTPAAARVKDMDKSQRSCDAGMRLRRPDQRKSPPTGPHLEHHQDDEDRLPERVTAAHQSHRRKPDGDEILRRWPTLDSFHNRAGGLKSPNVERTPAGTQSPRGKLRAPTLCQDTYSNGVRNWPRPNTYELQDKRTSQAPGTAKSPRTTGSSHRNCDHCSKGLTLGTRYRCQECSVELCSNCHLNASLIHPGHVLVEAVNTEHTASSGNAPDFSTAEESQIDRCLYCERKLPRERYDCEDCFDVVLICMDCGIRHDPEHVLRLVIRPAVPSGDDAPCSQNEPHNELRGDESGLEDENSDVGNPETGPNSYEHSEGDSDAGSSSKAGAPSTLNRSRRTQRSSKRAATSLLPAARDRRIQRAQQHHTRGSTSSAVSYDAARDTITFSRGSLVRFIIKAAVGIAEQAMGAQGASRHPAVQGPLHVEDDAEEADNVQADLLDFAPDFPADFDLDEEFALHSQRSSPKRSRRAGTGRNTRALWLPEDRRLLSKLKKRGWTDARIGKRLNRSEGAIAQQWRKQK